MYVVQYVLTCAYYTQDIELLFQAVHETISCSKNAQAKLNHSKCEDDVVTQAKYAPYICTLDLLRVREAGVGHPLNKPFWTCLAALRNILTHMGLYGLSH
jgi:hypothetical protein